MPPNTFILQMLKNKIFPILASAIGLKTLIRVSEVGVIHVFYHTVSDNYMPHIHPLYTPKTTKEFSDDMDYLLRNFEPISIQAVWESRREGQAIKKPSFHLSFDDGLRGIYDQISPILSEKGIPATVFVNSDFVDNKDLFYRYKAALLIDKMNEINGKNISAPKIAEINKILSLANIFEGSVRLGIYKLQYRDKKLLDEIALVLGIDFYSFLKHERPYLESGELKLLQERGFTIGGHSKDHPIYEDLQLSEQIDQTLTSCDFVKNNFHEKNLFFAFPFYDSGVGEDFFSKIYPEIDLTFGISGIKSEYQGRHIHRIDMEKRGKNARQAIHAAYLTSIFKELKYF